MTTRKPSPMTNNERQARRREREKQWLSSHGFTSWESLHTALMNGMITLSQKDAIYTYREVYPRQMKGKQS